MDITSAFKEKVLGSPGSKVYDIPAFEEAFQEDHLKKFFQEQDTCSHVSSPEKDGAMVEEIVPPGGASQDLLASPMGRYVHRMNDENQMNGPILDVELEGGFDTEIGGLKNNEIDLMNQQRQQRMFLESNSYQRPFEKLIMPEMAENAQRTMFNQGLGIQKAMSLPSNPNQYFGNLPPQQMHSPNKRPLEDLIKNKQVFKIERNVRSPQVPKPVQKSQLSHFSLQPNGLQGHNPNLQQPILPNGMPQGQMLNFPPKFMNPVNSSANMLGSGQIMDFLQMRGKRPEDMLNFLNGRQGK